MKISELLRQHYSIGKALTRRIISMEQLRFRLRVFWIKAGNWEYWNSIVIYLPTLPYLLFLWMKSKSIFFFNAANPGIEYGGFLMESKWEIYNNAPAGFFPETKLIKPSEPFDAVVQSVRNKFQFPFIAKPDVGSQGRGVTVIRNFQQLRAYHSHCPVPYLIQARVTYPLEAGIFYVRMPNSPRGTITGIVQKRFIQVTGDGKNSLLALLLKNPRYALQADALKKLLGEETIRAIVPLGEERTVIEIGNHARGAMFLNASDKISEPLTNMIDTVCRRVDGFYFGRLDIRFENWEDLSEGKNFAVIELNGSGSEPTHMYDPGASIVSAWKEICRHWKIMQEISQYNHQQGVPYLKWTEGIQMFRENRALNKKLSHFMPVPLAEETNSSSRLSPV